jgi:xylose isomerase
VGNARLAKENPAEALHLLHSHGRLVDIERDDNYREWDDDLTAGALHLVETLRRLEERATQIDAQELADAQRRHDSMAIQSIMRKRSSAST